MPEGLPGDQGRSWSASPECGGQHLHTGLGQHLPSAITAAPRHRSSLCNFILRDLGKGFISPQTPRQLLNLPTAHGEHSALITACRFCGFPPPGRVFLAWILLSALRNSERQARPCPGQRRCGCCPLPWQRGRAVGRGLPQQRADTHLGRAQVTAEGGRRVSVFPNLTDTSLN